MATAIFVNLPVKNHGFMYEHGFQDLDGHIWEIMFMEASAINQGEQCEG